MTESDDLIHRLKTALASLEKAYDVTIEALGEALGLRERETGGHPSALLLSPSAFARAMDIPKEQLAVIARGAYLHDLGKMAIADAILLKPGALTPDETAIMRTHCYLGYKMLQKIPFLQGADEIVYSHHESYDGTGYPRGLKGEEIPLGARIVAVANTMDSICCDLPYRAARPFSVAKKEIQDLSGRQFDPKIVKVFNEIPDKLWANLAEQVRSQGSY